MAYSSPSGDAEGGLASEAKQFRNWNHSGASA